MLSVEARPWASVKIDGRHVGTTPLAPIDLPTGKHRVELENDDLGAHVVRTIDVRSGETSVIREKMVAAP